MKVNKSGGWNASHTNTPDQERYNFAKWVPQNGFFVGTYSVYGKSYYLWL